MTADKEQKLLTVSVAAYNAEETLGHALASLEADGCFMHLLDILIVDDGSSDGTGRIAEDFRSRYPDSVRVVRKENGGYGSTVNTSLKLAKGRYFKLLDADDSFDVSGLVTLLHCLENTGTDLIITPYICEKHTEFGIVKAVTDMAPDMQTEPVNIESASEYKGIPMFSICVRTDVFRGSGVRLTEHCFYTDNEFAMTAVLYSRTALRLDSPVYIYSTGLPGQSMSIQGRIAHRADKIRAAYGTFDIYEDHLKKDADNEISGSRKLIAEDIISMMVREVYVSHMLGDDAPGARSVLRAFDRDLKEERPHIYEISERSQLVRTARKAGGLMYAALCAKLRRDEEKRMGASYAPAWFSAAGSAAAACMIIQCRTEWMHLYKYGMIVNRAAWAVMMVSMLVMVLYKAEPYESYAACSLSGWGPSKLSAQSCLQSAAAGRKTAFICIAFAVYAGIFIVANPVNRLRVIRCASAVIMMILLVNSCGGRAKAGGIMRRFTDLMLIIAAASLALWFLSAVIHVLPMTCHVISDWTKTGGYVKVPAFLYIYFEPQPTDWAIMSARNSGIFTEGPMAGFCYCMALMAELFICGFRSKRMHKAAVILLVISVLSTLSLISYMGAFMAVAASALITKPGKDCRGISAKAAMTAAAAGMILCCFAFIKLTQGSGSIRMNDFATGFSAWLNRPLFGGGFESLDYLRGFMPEWRSSVDTGFSNSPAQILAQGGVYIASAYVYAFAAAAVRAVKQRDLSTIILIMLFAFMFTFTAVPYQYIVFYMLILMRSGCIQSDNSPQGVKSLQNDNSLQNAEEAEGV